MELLTVLWVSLLGDTPSDSFDKPKRLYRGFARALAQDALGLIKFYASLYDELTSSVSFEGHTITIDRFIAEFRDTPVFREYHEFYKTHDARLFGYLSTFLLFGKKAYYEDPDFNDTAFRGWLEVEEHLGGMEFNHDFLGDLREIIAWMLGSFDDTLFLPKHGPGTVAEKQIIRRKKGKPIRQAIRRADLKNQFLGLTDEASELLRRDDIFIDAFPDPALVRGKHSMANRGTSKLKFVPKDIGKARSICMEPASYQYAQQGVRLWFEQALADGPIGRHIPLRMQEQNQRLARYGSETGLVDTIDLSNASDSVHIELVKNIFEGDMLEYLLATRTSCVEVPGKVEPVEMHKFAPMGSALCFPIQSIVYAAIVLHGYLTWQFGKTAGSHLKLDRRVMYHYYKVLFADRATRMQTFSIYGDDIICDTRVTSIVIELLTQLGFSVNVSKSFTGDSAFRESCGAYYLLGEDVTPLRAKFGKVSDTMLVSTMASIIDLANRAFDMQYLNLRQHAIRVALHYPIKGVSGSNEFDAEGVNPILFTSNTEASFALYSPSPMNRHLAVRKPADDGWEGSDTHVRYQRNEFRSIGIRPLRTITMSSGDDWYRHVVWWRAHASPASDVEVGREIPVTTGPEWRWTSRLGD